MDIVIGIILVALVAIIAIAAVAFFRARAKEKEAERRKAAEAPRAHDPFAPSQEAGGDPRNIHAGDMIEHLGEKHWVRGTLRYTEGSYTWAEHFFQADSSPVRRWLSIEEDPDLEMSVWEDRPDLDLSPTDKTITVDGVTYTMVEHGTAQFRSEGTTGLPASGGVDYVDYEGPDGRFLSIERYNHGKWEASTGKAVPLGSFTIYPGS
ncbi:DUF4178 domain-containing protein [Brevibacterium samyangense]|uniref:DUF4178 domain-containing protein n=1 Tax=Brevibacterium samyangense TaxID=366888 RepID=A0ABN2T5F3_9MICO